ncbi:MAG: AAA family ATPase [Candidatus Sumerlaeota bacterium]|nr:AAA family ATPase [Candidatus Sumerlaeota bacterium]
MKARFLKIDLQGFKSIRRLPDFPLRNLNVLIGANGSGKSNLISFLQMLNCMAMPPGQLQYFIRESGDASALLHDGPDITSQIATRFELETADGAYHYSIALAYARTDTLLPVEEALEFVPSDPKQPPQSHHAVKSGAKESLLALADVLENNRIAQLYQALGNVLKQQHIFQFHNTSETSRIRQRWDVNDNQQLKKDGGNLAPILYRLRDSQPRHYQRIVEIIRHVAPFFADFELKPKDNSILLQWREKGSDLIFSPHQASDGTLRFMALITLLLQPKEDMPSLIILDEPELGLHPSAISLIAGFIKSASLETQIILATQSASLVDCFDPEDIVVVERMERESTFRRLEADQLSAWMEDYSLSELWEKNVFGGKPIG